MYLSVLACRAASVRTGDGWERGRDRFGCLRRCSNTACFRIITISTGTRVTGARACMAGIGLRPIASGGLAWSCRRREKGAKSHEFHKSPHPFLRLIAFNLVAFPFSLLVHATARSHLPPTRGGGVKIPKFKGNHFHGVVVVAQTHGGGAFMYSHTAERYTNHSISVRLQTNISFAARCIQPRSNSTAVTSKMSKTRSECKAT